MKGIAITSQTRQELLDLVTAVLVQRPPPANGSAEERLASAVLNAIGWTPAEDNA